MNWFRFNRSCNNSQGRKFDSTAESELCLRLDQDSQLDLLACQIPGGIVDQLQLWEKVFQGSWVEGWFDLKLFHLQSCQILF
jgi:hypothetical protein